MTEAKYLIYGLANPITRNVRYIGRSSTGIERPRRHWKNENILNDGLYVHNWCKKMLNLGFEPAVIIFEEFEEAADINEKLNSAEMKWISYYKIRGARLTNLTDGGEGCLNPSEFTREKMRDTKLGIPRLENTKKKISKGQKISMIGNTNGHSNLGRVNSNESKQNIANTTSDAIKNWWHGIKTIKCLNDGKMFVTMSETSRHYGISLASVRRSLTDGSERAGYRFIKMGKGV